MSRPHPTPRIIVHPTPLPGLALFLVEVVLPQFPKGGSDGSWGPRQTGVQAGCPRDCLVSILDEIRDGDTALLPLLPCLFEKEPKARKNSHP